MDWVFEAREHHALLKYVRPAQEGYLKHRDRSIPVCNQSWVATATECSF